MLQIEIWNKITSTFKSTSKMKIEIRKFLAVIINLVS